MHRLVIRGDRRAVQLIASGIPLSGFAGIAKQNDDFCTLCVLNR
jgi:hypothetical protein